VQATLGHTTARHSGPPMAVMQAQAQLKGHALLQRKAQQTGDMIHRHSEKATAPGRADPEQSAHM